MHFFIYKALIVTYQQSKDWGGALWRSMVVQLFCIPFLNAS